MGWRYGTEYETLPLDVPENEEKASRAALRARLRCHKLMMDGRLTHEEIRAHYNRLSEADQADDVRMVEALQRLDFTLEPVVAVRSVAG